MNIKSNMRNVSVPSVLFVFCVICLAVLLVIGSSLPVFAQGAVLYGSRYAGPDGPATLYRVDATTGAATIIGPIGYERCGGMDFDAAGTLFATAERNSSNTSVLITINPMTGAGTEIGEIGLEQSALYDVSFRNSDGTLFCSTHAENGRGCIALNTINTATGMGSIIGDIGTCDPGNAIAFSAADILFYWNSCCSRGGMLYTLNQVTGQATNVTPLLFPVSFNSTVVTAMDFHPGSGVLFATVKNKPRGDGPGSGDPKYLVTINTENGLVTTIGQTETDLDAIAFSGGIPVGGEVLPLNKAVILAPLVILFALIALGGTFTVMRRRYTC